MKISARLHAAELAIGRLRNREGVPAISVCDRIEELTALFVEHPPTFSPQIETGILAAVERDVRASLLINPS